MRKACENVIERGEWIGCILFSIVGCVVLAQMLSDPLARWMIIGATLLIALTGAYDAIKRRLERCQHGVRGGATKGACATCVRDAESAQLAANRKRELNKRADELERAEYWRIRPLLLTKKEHLTSMDPRRFETAVCDLFATRGFEVHQTPYVNDRGKDAVMFRDSKKILLEVKRYDPQKQSKIGRRDLQVFFAAIAEEHAYGGIFVSTSEFARTAREYAEENRIQLVGLDELVFMFEEIPSADAAEVIRALCRECGETVSFPLGGGVRTIACPSGHAVLMPARPGDRRR